VSTFVLADEESSSDELSLWDVNAGNGTAQ
jgi:hypothetical protein